MSISKLGGCVIPAEAIIGSIGLDGSSKCMIGSSGLSLMGRIGGISSLMGEASIALFSSGLG